jgi:hypothetical protein
MKHGTMGMAVALAMAAGTATQAVAQERDFEWSGRLDAGQELVVRGISGNVVGHVAPGADARVEARKTGRSSDFDRIDIVMSDEGDRLVFCVVYDGRRGDSDCDSGWDDREDDHGGRNIRAGVDFEVYVPAGVRFSGHTVSGDVEALGLRSDVDAATVSGNVTVATTGVATGRTVSGDVTVEMGSLDWRSLDFKTVSGDITVTVPEDVDAEIEFESLSGDFDSDFPLRVARQRDRFIGHHLEATIGGGSRTMTFKTVSGDARLRRARTELR